MMAIRSGFFNSVNGDRKYDAQRFAEYFASFIGNGVFPNPSTGLQVMANDDMTVTVKPGKAWINGYILINDDDYILQIEPADGVLNRIDRIVARYDIADREIRLEVKKGTFASSPIAPELQRDSDAYELGLADIYVKAGAISITQADITDLRLNSELCGIVHGFLEQVDTTTLFAQYQAWYQQTTGQAEADLEAIKQQFQADFQAWFDALQDTLDENTAGNLYNLIEEHKNDKNNPHEVTPEQINAASREEFVAHLEDDIAHNIPLKVIRLNKDENDIFTTVEYRRKSDNTLAIRSVLSGGTSPQYTTRTVTYYARDGETVIRTDVFTLSYDEDGALISEL